MPKGKISTQASTSNTQSRQAIPYASPPSHPSTSLAGMHTLSTSRLLKTDRETQQPVYHSIPTLYQYNPPRLQQSHLSQQRTQTYTTEHSSALQNLSSTTQPNAIPNSIPTPTTLTPTQANAIPNSIPTPTTLAPTQAMSYPTPITTNLAQLNTLSSPSLSDLEQLKNYAIMHQNFAILHQNKANVLSSMYQQMLDQYKQSPQNWDQTKIPNAMISQYTTYQQLSQSQYTMSGNLLAPHNDLSINFPIDRTSSIVNTSLPSTRKRPHDNALENSSEEKAIKITTENNDDQSFIDVEHIDNPLPQLTSPIEQSVQTDSFQKDIVGQEETSNKSPASPLFAHEETPSPKLIIDISEDTNNNQDEEIDNSEPMKEQEKNLSPETENTVSLSRLKAPISNERIVTENTTTHEFLTMIFKSNCYTSNPINADLQSTLLKAFTEFFTEKCFLYAANQTKITLDLITHFTHRVIQNSKPDEVTINVLNKIKQIKIAISLSLITMQRSNPNASNSFPYRLLHNVTIDLSDLSNIYLSNKRLKAAYIEEINTTVTTLDDTLLSKNRYPLISEAFHLQL